MSGSHTILASKKYNFFLFDLLNEFFLDRFLEIVISAWIKDRDALGSYKSDTPKNVYLQPSKFPHSWTTELLLTTEISFELWILSEYPHISIAIEVNSFISPNQSQSLILILWYCWGNCWLWAYWWRIFCRAFS